MIQIIVFSIVAFVINFFFSFKDKDYKKGVYSGLAGVGVYLLFAYLFGLLK